MNTESSNYIENCRKQYSLYIISSRAIPHLADGLKNGARRILWTAKSGKKFKSATLAGATMPLHPHGDQPLQGTINTLAAPYSNNIPLLHGDGAFGTLLRPSAYGASRYTSVTMSKFASEVMLTDIEIIPMQDNYDGSLQEPVHFLPLIPIVLINPQEGIAIGSSTNILPRDPKTVIRDQIKYLSGKRVSNGKVYFKPLDQQAEYIDGKWRFRGTFEQINTTTIKITSLPYGITHEQYEKKLSKLEEKGILINVVDNSRDFIDITLKFKRGSLKDKSEDDLFKLLSLQMSIKENLNVIDFNGTSILNLNYVQAIEQFTEWRLKFFPKRYQRLLDLILVKIQKYIDILTAIENNVGDKVRTVQTRTKLKTYLSTLEIVHLDYIADLPIYRFTKDEKQKTEEKLRLALKDKQRYIDIINSVEKQKQQYIDELKHIVKLV